MNNSLTAQGPSHADIDREAFLAAVSDGNLDQSRIAARRMLLKPGSQTRAAKLIRVTIEKSSLAQLRSYKIALLSSFSIEFVHDHLIALGYTEGLNVEIYQAGFDQYHQDIHTPESRLYRFAPDLVILAIDGTRLAPNLYSGFLQNGYQQSSAIAESVISKVHELITSLRLHTGAPVLLHSLIYPNHSELGVLDILDTSGQRQQITHINEKLAALGRQIGGVYLIDVNAVVQTIGYNNWHDSRLHFFARTPIGPAGMNALARVYLRYVRAISGNTRKCIVLDLDNTLWGGILGEEGPQGIELGSEYPGNAYVAFQRCLLNLRERGVLLAIASKNNPQDVDHVFAENGAMVLSKRHFSAAEIHWEPKSVSVARIAASLNLDPRHIVFVDDNPAECLEVEKAIPSITTITLPRNPEDYEEALLSEGLFDALGFSDEDRRRAELYGQREAAERLRSTAVSLEEYYRSLEMRVYIEPINSTNVARAAQMTQKTNQFNATTRRYTEAEITAMLLTGQYKGLAVRVVDTFGDNGIVGLLLARKIGKVCDVDTFLLSCRVINRAIEAVMLHWLTSNALKEGFEAVEGWIHVTERNVPVRDLYASHGFSAIESNERSTRWRLELRNAHIAVPEWFQITDGTERE
jgi:FkbH-like protein